MRFPLKTRRRYDKSYFRMVGIALLPALGVSIITHVVGRILGGSESVVETPQVSAGRDRTAPARRAEEDVLSRAKE